MDISELHLDEDTFTMYGRETGRFVELVDEKRVDEYHILDRTTLHLKVRGNLFHQCERCHILRAFRQLLYPFPPTPTPFGKTILFVFFVHLLES